MSNLPEVNVVKNVNAAMAMVNGRIGGKLSETQQNADILRETISKKWKFESVMAATPEQIADCFMWAVESLFFNPGALQYDQSPSRAFTDLMFQKRDQEMRAAQIKKAAKAKNENNEGAFWDRVKKDEAANQAAKEDVATEAKAQAQIDELIANFSVNASFPGRIDGVRTQQGREALSGIKIFVNGKYSAQRSLKVLQSAYYGETAAEIIRLADAAKEKMVDQINAPAGPRDSFGDGVKAGGVHGVAVAGSGAPPVRKWPY